MKVVLSKDKTCFGIVFWISFGNYEMYHVLRFEFWEKVKPFGLFLDFTV